MPQLGGACPLDDSPAALTSLARDAKDPVAAGTWCSPRSPGLLMRAGLPRRQIEWTVPRQVRLVNGVVCSSSYPPSKAARSADGVKISESLANEGGWHLKAYRYGPASHCNSVQISAHKFDKSMARKTAAIFSRNAPRGSRFRPASATPSNLGSGAARMVPRS